jgi:transcription initiation factor TFIIIB Brf1 subunit/transcription initiation factor TFIIB
MSKNPNNGCLHKETTVRDGFIVCRNCGMTLERQLVDSCSFYNPNLDSKQFRQAVSPGRLLGFSSYELGSLLCNNKKDLKEITNSHKRNRFRRLRNRQFESKNNENAYYKELIEISKRLDFTLTHQRDVAFNFIKAKKKNIKERLKTTNYFILYACFLSTIKRYNLPIPVEHVTYQFKSREHKITSYNRCTKLHKFYNLLNLNYKNYSIDFYLPTQISKILINQEIKQRFYKIGYQKKFEYSEYKKLFRKTAYSIINKLSRLFSRFGVNPYLTASTCMYATSLAIHFKNNVECKCLLTQNLVAEILDVSDHSVREVYLTYFAPFVHPKYTKYREDIISYIVDKRKRNPSN